MTLLMIFVHLYDHPTVKELRQGLQTTTPKHPTKSREAIAHPDTRLATPVVVHKEDERASGYLGSAGGLSPSNHVPGHA